MYTRSSCPRLSLLLQNVDNDARANLSFRHAAPIL
jgi:hypothetical protein